MNWQEIEHAGLGCAPVALGLIDTERVPLVFWWPEAELAETRDYLAALAANGAVCRVELPGDPAAVGEHLRAARGGVHCPVIGLWGRGTGATTLAWQLAQAWRARGLRLGVLDLDVRRPGLFREAGVAGKPAVLGRAIVPRSKDGVRLLSLTALLPSDRPLVARGVDLERLCRTFRDDALWRGLDVLLVDLPDLPEVAAMQTALFAVSRTIRLVGPLERLAAGDGGQVEKVLRLGTDLPIDRQLSEGAGPSAAYRHALAQLVAELSADLGAS